jgi:hypothetical protein
MISLNTWNTLYEGKYGSSEYSILYQDDIFVSFLKLRDQSSALVQVYKVFHAQGDVEIFNSTLPYPSILYEKHFNIGENNTFKYLFLNTETEYIELNTLSFYVDNKMQELNKRVSSVISIVKSYNIKLTSLKLATEESRNYFFSDPGVIKVLTNLPASLDFSRTTSLDKLIMGKKKDVLVTTSMDLQKSVTVLGGNFDERIYALKIICENHLLSSKTVIVLDPTKMFVTLAYPQSDTKVLSEYELKMDPFGFPVKPIETSEIKIPLGMIPLNAFINLFKLSPLEEKILTKIYSTNLITINDLRKKVLEQDIDEEFSDFEKQRLLSKLILLDKRYVNRFGDTDLSVLFEQRYKHIGSVKLLSIDSSDPIYPYFVSQIINNLSLLVKDDILLVLPESSDIFNNLFIGKDLIDKVRANPRICILLSSKSVNDFRDGKLTDVTITMITDNDAVIRYPNRDPLRLLLRPTFTSSNVSYKKVESIIS